LPPEFLLEDLYKRRLLLRGVHYCLHPCPVERCETSHCYSKNEILHRVQNDIYFVLPAVNGKTNLEMKINGLKKEGILKKEESIQIQKDQKELRKREARSNR